MSRMSICTPCASGDHKHHYRVIQPAPEGGVGGVVCMCEGECEDGRYKLSIKQLLGIGREF